MYTSDENGSVWEKRMIRGWFLALKQVSKNVDSCFAKYRTLKLWNYHVFLTFYLIKVLILDSKICSFNITLLVHLTNDTGKNHKNCLWGFFFFYELLAFNFNRSAIFITKFNSKWV